MIFVDLSKLSLPSEWLEQSKELTAELMKKSTKEERKVFIEAKRADTWANPRLLESLARIVGDKCWYSEVSFAGFDRNVDHFRPKGRVREINESDKSPWGERDGGYWWLAFDHRNFRLASQHANQRRVDSIGLTDGGKSDYFPVDGDRCSEGIACDLIHERILALDPCSPSDVKLLRFNTNGMPEVRKINGIADPWEERRVKLTIWLFHLNKSDIVKDRLEHMLKVKNEFTRADHGYRLWKLGSEPSKISFDMSLAVIKDHLQDNAKLAGAAQSMKKLLLAEYEWIDEYL